MLEGCSSLTQVTILSPIKSIESNAFCGFILLKQILILSSVIAIKKDAFGNCSSLSQTLKRVHSSLTQIEIQNTVQKLGENCFERCNKLTKHELKTTLIFS